MFILKIICKFNLYKSKFELLKVKAQNASNAETLIKNIKKDPQMKKYIDNKQIIKTIYVENKLINFIIKE